MNIKASATNKWLIDPDNQDGFALMWGGVKSNYGLLVPNNMDVAQDFMNVENNQEQQNTSPLLLNKIAFQIKVF